MMTTEALKQKILQYKWEFWADRPFGAFMLSFFKDGPKRKSMRVIGVDAEWPAALFQKGAFYRCDETWDIFARELDVYVKKGGSAFAVVAHCEEYGDSARVLVDALQRSDEDEILKLQKFNDIITVIISHCWLTHGFEHYYVEKLRSEVPKYMPGDLEKNIGDISFPIKKNAHSYFEQALRSRMPLPEVQQKFAWIKVRDGFSDGFTLDELSEERERLKKEPIHVFARPQIPDQLKELAAVAQELVYYRTLRTDILYELIYRSRPLLSAVAARYGLSFKELRDYSIYDLVAGAPERYEYGNVTALQYGEHFALVQGSVLDDSVSARTSELKGSVAYKGKIEGVARVVMTAQQIGKVQPGDILIAPTTAPSYIIGMQKAAAFVTDEGGITSHAAIVSREMKKPCVIGTKFATKVFKDGDLLAVDAERGIVKKIK